MVCVCKRWETNIVPKKSPAPLSESPLQRRERLQRGSRLCRKSAFRAPRRGTRRHGGPATLPQLNEGEEAQFIGEWVNDSRYGRSIRRRASIRLRRPAPSIINYLSSGIVKGIGPRTAEKIVNHLGEETIAILDSEPERLHEVPILKPLMAERLIEAWTKNRVMRNNMIMSLPSGHGHQSPRYAKRIGTNTASKTRPVISNNPYQLAQDVS